MVFDPTIIPNSQKLQLTLDNTPISADQSNFPLTIILDGVANSLHTNIFTDLGGNSKKISIQSNGTQLPIEIDEWDSSGQKAVIYVKVPIYTASSATSLVMSWDAAQDDNTTYVGDIGSTIAQSVWDSSFRAVYHLSQDPTGGTGCIKDSTSNAIHGTPSGTMTSGDLITGLYSKGLDFDGSDDQVATADTPFDFTAAMTLEVVAKTSSTTGNKELIAKFGDTVGNDSFILRLEGLTLRSMLYISSGWRSVGSQTVTAGNEFYAASTYNGSTHAAYLNQNTPVTASQTGNINQSSSLLRIASPGPAVSGEKWPGHIYEVRASVIVRSADWIKLTSLSLTDQLISWSVINKVSGTVTVSGSPAARTVAVFLRSDFTLLGTTTSDASTGAFEICNGSIPDTANALLVIAIDSADTYNAVSVDYITSVSS